MLNTEQPEYRALAQRELLATRTLANRLGVSVKQIAQEAGVCDATVIRALDGAYHVKPGTRAAILGALARLEAQLRREPALGVHDLMALVDAYAFAHGAGSGEENERREAVVSALRGAWNVAAGSVVLAVDPSWSTPKQ